jgi:hypothetical protein
MGIIAGETMADTIISVDVIIQSTLAAYGDSLVPVQVSLNNEGFDTIAGYSIYFNTGFPDMIDFVDTVDTAGTLSSGACFNSYIEVGDTTMYGDQITVVAHNLATDTCDGFFIEDQVFGELLFTLFVNVSDSCGLITDTNSALIQAIPVLTNISDINGVTIPESGVTSAQEVNLFDALIEVPGTLVLGDVDGSCNGQTGCGPSLGDVVYIVNFVFNKPGDWTACPPEAADVNCSGGIPTLGDAIAIVNYIFKGTPFSGCP